MSGSALSRMTAIASDEHRQARVETGTGSLGYDRSVIDYTLPLDELPDPLSIEPLSKPFDVTITPPGSKSITCRAYVLAALADGESKIIGPLRADDTDKLLDALCTLGAEARWDGADVYIKGVNGRFPRGGEVNLGDGGAPTRFMIACACLAAEPVVVDGSKRMRERPIAEGVDMLRKLGATIEYVEEEGRLPVRVVPSVGFKGGNLAIGETASSQSVSAVILLAPFLRHGLEWHYLDEARVTSSLYLALTCAVLARWGIELGTTGNKKMGYRGKIEFQGLLAGSFSVAPDASSAIYWKVATCLVQQSRLLMTNASLSPYQPDNRATESLTATGLITEKNLVQDARESSEYCSRKNKMRGIKSDCSNFPDASLTLAVLASTGKKTSRLTGLRTLRHKETDRIAALANELRKIGCTIETTDDSITIDPSTRHDDPVVIETYNDHRMAMAFGVLGLARPGISISNPACVSKSYPTFWRDFAKLYQ